jgi:hypothetical protein
MQLLGAVQTPFRVEFATESASVARLPDRRQQRG